jgi:hypothetical protein
MLSKDGGRSYEVVKKINSGTSGNFDGYGDLGTLVPAKKGDTSAPTATFKTIVGCNDCPGGSENKAAFLQTWVDDGSTLKLTDNVTIAYTGVPAAFTSSSACGAGTTQPKLGKCGLTPPDASIVRTPDGNLLAAFYGFASDGYLKGALYTTAYFSSADDGVTWAYSSRIDVTPAMVATGKAQLGEGPCEPALVTLADGRVLTALRLGGSIPLWMAYSSTNGKSWTEPAPAVGKLAATPSGGKRPVFAVWPQLLRLSNGALVLASGRPGIGFWLSPKADGAGEWIGYDVEGEHNRLVPQDTYTNGSSTTSYTGIAEVEPGVVLLAYDKLGSGGDAAIQSVYAMRITVTP